jgi:hypothetical protein
MEEGILMPNFFITYLLAEKEEKKLKSNGIQIHL